MRVAILGTGKMGAAVAGRLQETGFELHLWNRTPAKAEALGLGTVASNPEAAAAAAEVVISVLTGPSAVRAVYGRLEPGTRVFLEMSTAGPDIAEELGTRYESLVAAPIIAAPPVVRRGEAYILTGGPEEAVERAGPVLNALGEHRHVGTRRRAAEMKLLNNAMLAVTTAAAAELVEATVHAGLSREEAFAFAKRHIPYLDMRRSGFLGGPYEPLTFALKDMLKDVDLALEAFDGKEFPMPILKAVRRAFKEVAPQHGEKELTAVLERYRKK